MNMGASKFYWNFRQNPTKVKSVIFLPTSVKVEKNTNALILLLLLMILKVTFWNEYNWMKFTKYIGKNKQNQFNWSAVLAIVNFTFFILFWFYWASKYMEQKIKNKILAVKKNKEGIINFTLKEFIKITKATIVIFEQNLFLCFLPLIFEGKKKIKFKFSLKNIFRKYMIFLNLFLRMNSKIVLFLENYEKLKIIFLEILITSFKTLQFKMLKVWFWVYLFILFNDIIKLTLKWFNSNNTKLKHIDMDV